MEYLFFQKKKNLRPEGISNELVIQIMKRNGGHKI